ncbi:hypothetical protein CU097_009353 [Rhizopus azygosporus]|uniref:PiggyBac transposable element-derived protein domain-containing protein n=1 Tax=Rhizopus azygosporus TaxID=86630 RepID=A0A367JFK0_RHIAZ|nr:hypothetical protein CU097_009353 [Rhizopus azygosporus]
MQVTKRHYWPQGVPETDIVESVDVNYGNYYTMKKDTTNRKMFVYAFWAQKVKAFVSSCGTTRLTGEKTLKSSDGNLVTIKRPEVVDEYERHKISMDAANSLQDNLISCHDIISTERWGMRFFGFFLGLCGANAYSYFRVFSEEGASRGHSSFKDNLDFNMLEHSYEIYQVLCGISNMNENSQQGSRDPSDELISQFSGPRQQLNA